MCSVSVMIEIIEKFDAFGGRRDLPRLPSQTSAHLYQCMG